MTMAVMLETRTLRKRPENGFSGASMNIDVKQGTIVEVLSELDGFDEIRAASLAGAPVGWVSAKAVDKTAGALPPLDANEFAAVVAGHAGAFGVNPHFLAAYAHMRSGLRLGMLPNGVEKGPFGFSAAEWVFFGSRPDLGVDLPDIAIDEWRSQSLVAALRMMLTQNLVAEALGRQPNATELALALMCGPKTAAAIIADPAKPVETQIAANAAENAESAGVDRANINLRFAEFLAGQTGKAGLDKIGAKLQASLDATRPSMEALGGAATGSASSVIGGGAPASVTIDISGEDIDALARVAKSEVGHFAMHGEDQLTGGLSAVVDTIFNRTAHTLFPDSIQAVINQEKQFSAINPLKTWKKLPAAPQEIFDIVAGHVADRLAGQPSIVKGATHFLNPFFSSASSMKKWGQFVMDHPVAIFGNKAKQDVHFHGTAPGTGKPADYLLKRGEQSAHFDPDGQLMAALIGGAAGSAGAASPSEAAGIAQRIVENAIAEWNFFEQGTRQESDDPQFLRIGDYWKVVGETFNGRSQIPDPATGGTINPFWSSAFISFIVKVSGGADRFLYSQAHSNYVQDFVKGRPGGLYEARRPEGYAPVPGDIVHSGRAEAKKFDFDAARERFKADRRYSSHSDFVVEVNREKGFLITIGGNVSQSVAKTTLKLNGDGTLKNRVSGGVSLPWIAVLRCLG